MEKSLPTLHCQALGLGYGQPARVLMKSLSLEFLPGQLVCLMGPNGVGKSTLLRVLGGMQPPLSGTVFLGEEALDKLNPAQRARQLSLVFTAAFSPGPISVYALVSMGRYPYADWLGRLSDEDHRQVQEALVMTDTQHLAHRKVQELSDGERQKVMIARALAQDTPFLLLDEPTAHLDLSNRLEIFRQLQHLSREQGKGIIVATHQLDQALQVADRICLLTREGTCHVGSPEDLVLGGQLEATFGQEKLSFDPENGTFGLARHPQHFVSLKGEGLPAIWTRKALLRKGIGIAPDQALTISIQDEAPRWKMEGPGGVGEFDKLDMLLAEVSVWLQQANSSHT